MTAVGFPPIKSSHFEFGIIMNTNDKTHSKETQTLADASAEKAHLSVSRLAGKADHAIAAVDGSAAAAEKSVNEGIHQIREAVPATLSRAAREAENMAHSGIDKARAAGESVTKQANEMSDQTAEYTRREPTKALLMAAAAGAVATLLIGWASRGNAHPRR
jgi:ElaB/YqjD/DUF883 family membrane-anchored ribosome-binding protein